jgi:hypothetical protein
MKVSCVHSASSWVKTMRTYRPKGKQARRENSSCTLSAGIVSPNLWKLANACARIFPGQKWQVMNDSALAYRILTQGKALVRAIEALGTMEPSGQFRSSAVASSIIVRSEL